MVSSQIWWFVSRASGIVAFGMLTCSMVLGVVLSSDLFTHSRRPRWLTDFHRGLASLTLSFLALHVVSLLWDPYLDLSVADLVVPFSFPWKRGAVALGVLAAWVVVAVQMTSLARKSVPRRVWRWVHLSSYVAFAATALHGALAGSDARHPMYIAATTLAVALVMAGSIYRVLQRRSRRPREGVEAMERHRFAHTTAGRGVSGPRGPAVADRRSA